MTSDIHSSAQVRAARVAVLTIALAAACGGGETAWSRINAPETRAEAGGVSEDEVVRLHLSHGAIWVGRLHGNDLTLPGGTHLVLTNAAAADLRARNAMFDRVEYAMQIVADYQAKHGKPSSMFAPLPGQARLRPLLHPDRTASGAALVAPRRPLSLIVNFPCDDQTIAALVDSINNDIVDILFWNDATTVAWRYSAQCPFGSYVHTSSTDSMPCASYWADRATYSDIQAAGYYNLLFLDTTTWMQCTFQ